VKVGPVENSSGPMPIGTCVKDTYVMVFPLSNFKLGGFCKKFPPGEYIAAAASLLVWNRAAFPGGISTSPRTCHMSSS
jgi:hypothetical protein